ncbi:MAG: HU family DNA-binding protein [Bacteroides sp.]|nr:HU family DNA-binding protein [Bacteroides sp.]
MDNKSLVDVISQKMGREPNDISALIAGMATVIKNHLCEMDTIAIPGFGEFNAIKHEEKVQPDLSTGKLMLLPPAITVEFRPSSLLKRKLNDAQ